MERLTGQVVGHYRLGAPLDEGGTAPVYRGAHILHGLDAAVKILSNHLSSQPGLRDRLQRAAQPLNSLRHPGLVRVTDYIVDGEMLALAMPLLAGESLAQQQSRRSAPAPPSEALRWLLPPLEALAAAHALQVVHGAITPRKLMLAPEPGEPASALLGCGLAEVVAPPPLDRAAAAKDSGPNPLWYRAPEQCRSTPSAGPAADQYAMAALFYQLVTGSVPCDADTAEGILDAHRLSAPLPPTQLTPGLPPSLSAALLRALAKNPEGRWPDISALTSALRAAIPPHGAATQPATVREPAPNSEAPAPDRATPPPTDLQPAPIAKASDGMAPVDPVRPEPPQAAPPPPEPRTPMPSPTLPRARLWWSLGVATVIAGSVALALLMARCPSEPSPPRGPSKPVASATPPRRDAGTKTFAAPDATAIPIPLPRAGGAPPGGFPRTGAEACDRYLAAYQCYLKQLPKSVQPTLSQALRKMAATWRQLAKGPSGRELVEKSCTNAYQGVARTLGTSPAGKGCFPGLAPPRPTPRIVPRLSPLKNPRTRITGIAPCDKYLKLLRCFSEKFARAGGSTALHSVERLEKSWKQTASTPSGRAALEPACRKALSSLRTSLRRASLAQGCLK